MNFTVDQSKVLEDKSKNLLVSASAGSGKTATIIEKIYKLVEKEHIDVQKMLVITFTEAASNETKIRLRDRLREGVKSDRTLQTQLEKLPLADISTLHSYCSKMLRKYFYYLDLKPNFAVLDEGDSKFLKFQALEKILKDYSKKDDEEFVLLSSIFDAGRGFDSLKRNILSVFEFLSGVEDREVFKNEISLSCYEKDLNKNVACKYLNNYIIINFNFLLRELNSYLDIAISSNAEFFSDFLKQIIISFQNVNKNKNFIYNQNIVRNIVLPRLTNKKLSQEDEDFKNDFMPFWNILKDRLTDIKKVILNKDEDEIKQDLEIAKKFLIKFQEVEEKFEDQYIKLKNKRNGLDFNDLEKFFLKLLEVEEVKNGINYDYIFVDEYQDINCVQEKILKQLSLHSKMVMVGDVKQSIYAFRNSTPEIFVKKAKSFRAQKENGKVIDLNENFRSNKIILEFVNQIFKTCMSDEFGGVDYLEKGMLKSQVEYKKCSNIPVVEVDIVDNEKEEKESEDFGDVYSISQDKNEYAYHPTESRKEAMIVARKILDIIGKEYYDIKSKTTKKIEFSDISILCRKNDFLKDVAKVLEEYKVPIETNLLDNIYKNNDVALLLSLLKVVDNFHDDNALSVVMVSPFYNFTFDELATIRREYNDETFFYNSVKNYSKNKKDKISLKIDFLINSIASIKENLTYKSIYDELTDICEEFEYFDFLQSLPDGSNRVKVVKDFIKSFINAEYNYDLVGFLDFEKNYASDGSFKSSITSGNNSVKMGTIHSSKGLEYPIVFLVGCGNAFSNKTFVEDILKDKDFGFGISTYNLITFEKKENIARNCITLYKRRSERAEELRLLYVALTRAKNHLFVIGGINLEKSIQVDSIDSSQGVNNYMAWILSMLSRVNFKNLTQNKVDLEQKMQFGKVDFRVYKDEDFEFENKNKISFLPKKQDTKDIENLRKTIDFEIKKKKNIALKNSVSSLLLESSNDIESYNFEPKQLSIFEGKKEGYKANKLGTIYHSIVEKIDFSREFKKVEFDKIIDELLVEKEYLKFISFEKIKICVEKIQGLGRNIKTTKELPFISYIPYNEIFGGEENNKVIVQGIADLVVEDGKKCYLIDYKTTKVLHPDQLVDRYFIQLKLYRICLEKALNKRFDGVYIYSFVLDKLIKVF